MRRRVVILTIGHSACIHGPLLLAVYLQPQLGLASLSQEALPETEHRLLTVLERGLTSQTSLDPSLPYLSYTSQLTPRLDMPGPASPVPVSVSDARCVGVQCSHAG